MTAGDYIVEILSLVLVLTSVVFYIIYWIKAAEVVPTHYNAYGEADNYGSKHTLLILPGLNILIYVAFTILNKYPHLFNYPVAVTEQNATSLYRIAAKMVRYMKLLICLLFTFLIVSISQKNGFNSVVYWILIAVIVLYPVFVIVKMIKIKNQTD
ncbi:MAG: DUF1648 domain-containing protein [Planctomycetaceae bacterium]|nr:DUF1648 domain-containing protein [Planctomycetaceae bacterium]